MAIVLGDSGVFGNTPFYGTDLPVEDPSIKMADMIVFLRLQTTIAPRGALPLQALD
jgi:hypothetical protein